MTPFGLPSLRNLDEQPAWTATLRIWLCVGPTDMRCGFDRLAETARHVTGQDPLGGHLGAVHLFVFRNRVGDRLKALYWDRDGFVLFYKRLERGRFPLPAIKAGQAAIVLRPSELAMLLDGIDLASVKQSRRYTREMAKSAAK